VLISTSNAAFASEIVIAAYAATQCLFVLWALKDTGSRIGVRDDGFLKDLGSGSGSGQKLLACMDAGMWREQDAVATQATLCIHLIPVVR